MHCGDAQFLQGHVRSEWRDRSFDVHRDQRCDFHLYMIVDSDTFTPLGGICDLGASILTCWCYGKGGSSIHDGMFILVASAAARSSSHPSDSPFPFLGVCQCQRPSYQRCGTLDVHPDLAAECSGANITDCKDRWSGSTFFVWVIRIVGQPC
jgi:hypothetical protein